MSCLYQEADCYDTMVLKHLSTALLRVCMGKKWIASISWIITPPLCLNNSWPITVEIHVAVDL